MRGHWKQRSAKGSKECQAHFGQRLLERYGISLSADRFKDLCADVQMGRARFLAKESNSRTHWLLSIDGQPVRAVYDKNHNALVTALPLTDHSIASVGTHPTGGDAKQAPCASMGDAVREAQTPTPNPIGDNQ